MRAEAERDYLEYMRARLHYLYRTAYLLCGDTHLAEDLVQSTALVLYRKWHRIQAADNIDAYVRRVLVNEFLGERRRPWSRVVLFDRTPEQAAPEALSVEERQELRAALDRVPPRRRAVLVLRYLCDLSVEETAAVLGCSTGTVKSQAARGLAAMRKWLVEPSM
jgi:RNA polymerase sigma-70 factor (sigma-E family)